MVLDLIDMNYNGANSYLFATCTEINLKQKILKLQQIHYVKERLVSK